MAALNYYAGISRQAGLNKDLVVNGTSSAGSAVDVEIRMQIDNGSGATGLTKHDVVTRLKQLLDYVESNGFNSKGGNLPAR